MVNNALRAPRRKDLKSESERYKLKPLPPQETAVRDDKASLVTLRVNELNRAQPRHRCRPKGFEPITVQANDNPRDKRPYKSSQHTATS